MGVYDDLISLQHYFSAPGTTRGAPQIAEALINRGREERNAVLRRELQRQEEAAAYRRALDVAELNARHYVDLETGRDRRQEAAIKADRDAAILAQKLKRETDLAEKYGYSRKEGEDLDAFLRKHEPLARERETKERVQQLENQDADIAQKSGQLAALLAKAEKERPQRIQEWAIAQSLPPEDANSILAVKPANRAAALADYFKKHRSGVVFKDPGPAESLYNAKLQSVTDADVPKLDLEEGTQYGILTAELEILKKERAETRADPKYAAAIESRMMRGPGARGGGGARPSAGAQEFLSNDTEANLGLPTVPRLPMGTPPAPAVAAPVAPPAAAAVVPAASPAPAPPVEFSVPSILPPLPDILRDYGVVAGAPAALYKAGEAVSPLIDKAADASILESAGRLLFGQKLFGAPTEDEVVNRPFSFEAAKSFYGPLGVPRNFNVSASKLPPTAEEISQFRAARDARRAAAVPRAQVAPPESRLETLLKLEERLKAGVTMQAPGALAELQRVQMELRNTPGYLEYLATYSRPAPVPTLQETNRYFDPLKVAPSIRNYPFEPSVISPLDVQPFTPFPREMLYR